MPFKKNNPGCACCCPTCTAPTPVPTGSTSANSAWYLTPDDPADVTHQDRASYHAVSVSYQTCVNYAAFAPSQPWAKFRSYFAYENEDNCAYLEIWGVYSLSLGGTITWNTQLVAVSDATETVMGSHSKVLSAVGVSSPLLAIAYDENSGQVRAIAIIPYTGTATAWYSYDYELLSDAYYSGNYGLRYGWGFGQITGDISGLAKPSSPTSNLRHIDYCQGFPHWTNIGATTLYHPWIKSAILEMETLIAEPSGISGCPYCNAPQTLQHPAEAFMRSNQTTFDMISDEIETSWTGNLPSTLGGYAITWLLSLRLDVGWPFARMGVTLSIVGRYRYVVGSTTFYGDPIALAYQSVGFSGECDPPEYDARDAVDGLVFNDWTLYDFSVWPSLGGSSGVPDLSGIEVVLSIP